MLTGGPGRLLPSDLAPVLQDGIGPSSDFLAKISGVDIPLFLCNTQFYFPLSSLLFLSPIKENSLYFTVVASLVAYVSTVQATWVQFPSRPLLITRSLIALEVVKCHLFFKFLHLFILSFFLYSHSRMREAHLVSQLLLPQDCHHQTQTMLGILKFKVHLPMH
jgi:hypothetical protein